MSCTTVKQKSTHQNFFLKINIDKTYADGIGAIMLYFDVVNNSNKEITILKPNNTVDHRINFFSNTMECKDIPIWSTEYLIKHIAVIEKDYLIIKPNSSAEILMNGRTFGWLACNSDSVEVSVKYEPTKNIINMNGKPTEKQKAYNEVINKISDINIYSGNLKFKLNK